MYAIEFYESKTSFSRSVIGEIVKVLEWMSIKSQSQNLTTILALMRHTSCLNKFYHPTDDRNTKAKLFIQKCKDDYQLTKVN